MFALPESFDASDVSAESFHSLLLFENVYKRHEEAFFLEKSPVGKNLVYGMGSGRAESQSQDT